MAVCAKGCLIGSMRSTSPWIELYNADIVVSTYIPIRYLHSKYFRLGMIDVKAIGIFELLRVLILLHVQQLYTAQKDVITYLPHIDSHLTAFANDPRSVLSRLPGFEVG